MKIVFFGTSNHCLPILEALNTHFDLKLVITRPDKPVGRKKVLTPSATKKWAIDHKIDSFTPETLKKDLPAGKAGTQDQIRLISQIRQIQPDLAIVADFGSIIPEAIFNLPKFKTFNIHFSKLPDLRGPSPVQFTLLRGDTEAWVTIFQIEAKMDTGPILWQKSFPIDPNDTTQTLYTRLFEKVAKIIPDLIPLIPQTPLIPQLHQNATFCRCLTKDDGFIDWSLLQQSLQGQTLQKASIQSLPKIQQEALQTKKISNFIRPVGGSNLLDFYRAVTPWPGLWTIKDDKRLIIRKCHLEEKTLILDEIQFEGKTPQPF